MNTIFVFLTHLIQTIDGGPPASRPSARRKFHPQAWRTDAFSFEWDDLRTYAFHPWRHLQRVLTTVHGSRNLRMLLIASCWPNSPVLRLSSSATRPRRRPCLATRGSSRSREAECGSERRTFDICTWLPGS